MQWKQAKWHLDIGSWIVELWFLFLHTQKKNNSNNLVCMAVVTGLYSSTRCISFIAVFSNMCVCLHWHEIVPIALFEPFPLRIKQERRIKRSKIQSRAGHLHVFFLHFFNYVELVCCTQLGHAFTYIICEYLWGVYTALQHEAQQNDTSIANMRLTIRRQRLDTSKCSIFFSSLFLCWIRKKKKKKSKPIHRAQQSSRSHLTFCCRFFCLLFTILLDMKFVFISLLW